MNKKIFFRKKKMILKLPLITSNTLIFIKGVTKSTEAYREKNFFFISCINPR
jgi:hypothetical protein